MISGSIMRKYIVFIKYYLGKVVKGDLHYGGIAVDEINKKSLKRKYKYIVYLS